MNHKFDVNKLRVAKPCHMSWENMSGDERVRLCNSCDMNIYNISEMTSAEITSLIETREGRLCGRIVRRDDGTVMTKDCPPGVRAYRNKISRFASAAFATILGLVSFGYGQTYNAKKAKSLKKLDIERIVSKDSKTQISGEVSGQSGLLPGAEIILIRKDKDGKKKIIKTTSNEYGKYYYDSVPEGVYTLKAYTQGFKKYKITNLIANDKEDIKLSIRLEFDGKQVVVGTFYEGDLINSSNGALKTTISGDTMRKLPIKNE